MQPGTEKILAKALAAVAVARSYRERGALDLAAGRCFYAMLHAARAVLNERGVRARTHTGVSAALRDLAGLPNDFAVFAEWLDAALCRRAAGVDAADPVESEVQAWIERAAAFTAGAATVVAGSTKQSGGDECVCRDQPNSRP